MAKLLLILAVGIALGVLLYRFGMYPGEKFTMNRSK